MLVFLTIAYSQTQNLSRCEINLAHKLAIFLIAKLFLLASLSPAAAVSAQQTEQPPSILLTEIFYDTPAVDIEQEWVELSNFGSTAIDLTNYKLGDEEQSGGQEGMLHFPAESNISPGQIIVVAQSARGFRALYGRDPDYEIADSSPLVPDMRRYALWSTGDFALANDGDELLLLDDQNRVVDSINYGDKTTYFDPPISTIYTGQSIERAPASCDTGTAADWQPSRVPSPGTLNLEGQCESIAAAAATGEPLLSIGQIQGAADVSPYVNQQVEFRGIVTGILEDRNSAGINFYTLFVQDMPGQEDDDPQTSNGIAIFNGQQIPPYEIGDLLHISGQVTEFFGLTEIDDRDLHVELVSRGNPLPDAVLLDLPPDTAARREYTESHESMLVSFPDSAVVVGPTHTGCGFALSDGQTGQNRRPRLTADDDIEQPMLILHNSDIDCHDLPDVKTGDQVSAVSGPLTYHFDQYKIVLQNSDALQVTAAGWPTLPTPFQPSIGQFTVATLNLYNHFDDVKDDPTSAEPVVAAADLAVKQKKLAVALGQTLGCPTIVALQEVENEGLLRSLVDETAAICGFTYEISHRDSADSRGLDLALLTDPNQVEVTAVALRQTCTTIDTGIDDPNHQCRSSESPLFGRPPLQVDLQIAGTPYTIYVNHFKSKLGGAEETAPRRLQQAGHIAQLVDDQLAADPEARIIVLGDFNDYQRSPALLQMTERANLINALQQLPISDRYSYIFDGVPQLIDGILVSPAVIPDIVDTMIIHANADYPAGLASDTSQQGLALRASDHDPLLLLLYVPDAEIPNYRSEFTPTQPPMPTRIAEPVAVDRPSVDPTFAFIWFFALIGLVVLMILLLAIRRRGR